MILRVLLVLNVCLRIFITDMREQLNKHFEGWRAVVEEVGEGEPKYKMKKHLQTGARGAVATCMVVVVVVIGSVEVDGRGRGRGRGGLAVLAAAGAAAVASAAIAS